MKLAARARTSATSWALSTRGLPGLITDVAHLRHAIGIVATVLADHLEHWILVAFASHLDQEITGIHLEHARQQVAVGHVGAVDRVAVAAGTGVNADPRALLRREPVEHTIVQLD